jgi:hypothetical protein
MRFTRRSKTVRVGVFVSWPSCRQCSRLVVQYQLMNQSISHDRNDESLEAKARWFQSLSLAERMELLCEFTELVLENNPRVPEVGRAQSSTGRVHVLSIA